MTSRQAPDPVLDRPLRVAQVNDVAHVAATLVPALRELGVDAELVGLPRPGARLARPLAVATSPLRQAAWLATVPRLRRGDYDILDVHFAWRGLVALPAGVPFVVHCHGTDVRGIAPGSVRGRIDGLVLRRAARVYYATPDLAEVVRGWRPDAGFAPNPIDESRFTPGGTAERDLLVGIRAEQGKGVDTVAAIVAAIVRARPGTSVTVVAHGPAADRLVAAAGPDVRVVAPVGHAAMPGLLRAHRVAIGQAAVGSIGNYELEALATGLPVVADFRYPEAYDVPPPTLWGPDAEATGRAVAALLDDDAERARLAADGRDWLVEHHAARAVAARLLADYRVILERASRTRGR